MKRDLTTIIAIHMFIFFMGCSPKPGNIIMTVHGPIPAEEMGITLVHEHVLVDFIGADSTGYHRWNKREAAERVIPFLSEIQNMNVETLIECTPAYVGRDPDLLNMLSEQTGIQLVTNTGYYGAQNNKFIPKEFYGMTAREISEVWISEFKNGIEGSGIRPGFIKIAVEKNDTLSPEHIKIVTAAAYTHHRTGMVIASHTGPDNPAFEQIKILKSYGVNPSSFIWVHAQLGSLEGNIAAAKQGAWISLDNVNDAKTQAEEKFSVVWYADRIMSLKEEGLLDRVLISHDAGWYSPGQENGGSFRGYSGILTTLVPVLKEHGMNQAEIDQLLITNPREAFGISPPV